MKELDSGKEKIRKICETIKEETLVPAIKQAESIVNEAHLNAKKIIEKAELEAAELVKNAHQKVENEKELFNQSLSQATKQSLEALKCEIESKLFHSAFSSLLAKEMDDPKMIAAILDKLVQSAPDHKEMTAILSNSSEKDQVIALLGTESARILKEEGIEVGDFKGGAKLSFKDQGLTFDFSMEAVKELFTRYLRKDYRKLIFNA